MPSAKPLNPEVTERPGPGVIPGTGIGVPGAPSDLIEHECPPHMVWDAKLGQCIPMAEAHMVDRLAEPMDLEANLAAYQRMRETLTKFVREYLEEAEYDKDGKLVAGKTNDYYRFPGAPADAPRALTKRGGEKLAKLHRFAKKKTTQVAATETQDYTSATVEVELVDNYGRSVGSGVSSCNTAEQGFQTYGARKKYGAQYDDKTKEWKRQADYRAAQNDVVARAAKRAFVQAVIVATGSDEFFTVARDDEHAPAPGAPKDDAPAPVQGAAPAPAAPASGPRFPPKFGKVGGKLVSEVSSDALQAVLTWCRSDGPARHGINPAALQPLVDAVAGELDIRSAAILEKEIDDLPF